MVSSADAHRIAAQLWPGPAVALDELPGGITNVNYKASTPDGTYVIRLFGQDAELLQFFELLQRGGGHAR